MTGEGDGLDSAFPAHANLDRELRRQRRIARLPGDCAAYLLRCTWQGGRVTFYAGSATGQEGLRGRMRGHAAGRARATRSALALELVHVSLFGGRLWGSRRAERQALAEERRLKKLPAAAKRALAEAHGGVAWLPLVLRGGD